MPGGVTYILDTVCILQKKKTSAVRSRISSKLIFASYVGYFDREYHGFNVTYTSSIYYQLFPPFFFNEAESPTLRRIDTYIMCMSIYPDAVN